MFTPSSQLLSALYPSLLPLTLSVLTLSVLSNTGRNYLCQIFWDILSISCALDAGYHLMGALDAGCTWCWVALLTLIVSSQEKLDFVRNHCSTLFMMSVLVLANALWHGFSLLKLYFTSLLSTLRFFKVIENCLLLNVIAWTYETSGNAELSITQIT